MSAKSSSFLLESFQGLQKQSLSSSPPYVEYENCIMSFFTLIFTVKQHDSQSQRIAQVLIHTHADTLESADIT